MAAERRRHHDHEASALNMADNAHGGDRGHVLIGAWTRLRPSNCKAKAMASARSRGSAGVSLSDMRSEDIRAIERNKNKMETRP